MSNNKNYNSEEQGDQFDASSLEGLIEPSDDEYEVVQNGDTDEDDDENYDYLEDEDKIEEKQTFMNNLASSMNLTGKSKLVMSALLLGAIAVIIIFNPFGKSESAEGVVEGAVEEKQGFFSSIKSKFGGGDEEAPSGVAPEGEELIATIMRELEMDNPGYEIAKNEDNAISLTGVLEDKPHVMTYSAEGELLSEILDGQQLVEGGGVPTTDGTTGVVTGETETPPTEVGQAEIPDYETPEDKVLMNKVEYDKSISALNVQSVLIQNDENGNAYLDRAKDKFIVQYEKLPLKGKIPMLYSKVIETGETIIFPITLEQYFSMADSGTTVIGVEITMMHGVESYDNIDLVEWKR